MEQLKINKNNSTKIKNIIKDSPFFEGLLSKKDILENITSRCNKEIILVGTQISMIIAIAAQFGIEIDSIKAKDIVSSLAKTTGVGTVIGGAGKIIGSNSSLLLEILLEVLFVVALLDLQLILLVKLLSLFLLLILVNLIFIIKDLNHLINQLNILKNFLRILPKIMIIYFYLQIKIILNMNFFSKN